VRELYGLPWSSGRQAAFVASVAAARAFGSIVPDALARGYNTRAFALVAKTERRRIDRGQATPGLRN
jgi:hypothetical protein